MERLLSATRRIGASRRAAAQPSRSRQPARHGRARSALGGRVLGTPPGRGGVRAAQNHRASEPDRLDPRLRAKVVALGQRLPELWANPSVVREHRTALFRCLIDKVVMRRAARDKADVRIVWRSGEITEMTVILPVDAISALPRHAEMEARVLELMGPALMMRSLPVNYPQRDNVHGSGQVLPTTV